MYQASMKQILRVLIFSSSSLALVSNGQITRSEKVPRNSPSSLSETARKELSIASSSKNKTISKDKQVALSVKEESANYLQATLPEDSRDNQRSSWLVEMGVENQKPQGTLEFSSLSPFSLDNLESSLAVMTSLSWWFGSTLKDLWGTKWQSALELQLAWSFHNYQLDVPGSSGSENVRLHVIKPELDLLLERNVGLINSWNTEIWVGATGSYGRLIQSQTSQKSDLLSTSLSENFLGAGLQARALVSQQISFGMKYFYRSYAKSKGKTHHAQLALGIAL